jgi:hypothetical protein
LSYAVNSIRCPPIYISVQFTEHHDCTMYSSGFLSIIPSPISICIINLYSFYKSSHIYSCKFNFTLHSINHIYPSVTFDSRTMYCISITITDTGSIIISENCLNLQSLYLCKLVSNDVTHASIYSLYNKNLNSQISYMTNFIFPP